jgi:hypothetical protein
MKNCCLCFALVGLHSFAAAEYTIFSNCTPPTSDGPLYRVGYDDSANYQGVAVKFRPIQSGKISKVRASLVRLDSFYFHPTVRLARADGSIIESVSGPNWVFVDVNNSGFYDFVIDAYRWRPVSANSDYFLLFATIGSGRGFMNGAPRQTAGVGFFTDYDQFNPAGVQQLAAPAIQIFAVPEPSGLLSIIGLSFFALRRKPSR